MLLTNTKGFTLIEVIVSIAVLAIVGVISTSILFRTFKGATKADLIGTVKQNGQGITSRIEQAVKSADDIICPTTSQSTNTLVVKASSGIYTRFVIYTQPNPTTNGCVAMDTPTVSPLPDPNLTCSNLALNPPTCVTSPATETNSSKGVSVVTGTSPTISEFNVNKLSGYKDVVLVRLNLTAPVLAPSGFESSLGPTPYIFETTIQLR